MLIKRDREILDYMAGENRDAASRDFNFENDLDEMAKALGISSEALRSAVRDLERRNFITLIRNQKGRACAFRLDHKGLNYKEYNHLESLERWKERIIGFISGVLSTVIAAYITGVL